MAQGALSLARGHVTILAGWFDELLTRLRPMPARRPLAGEAPLREGWFERWLVETGFLTRYPHYAGVLARMDPIATQAVETMAVALRRWDDPRARIQLLANLDYFEEHPEHRAGILLHEIQHVVLGHLGSLKLHAVPHPRLMELAMELSANEPVLEAVPGGLHIHMFAELGISAGQSTMERYALLAEAYEDGRLSIMDWWSSRMLDVHRPRRDGACRDSGLGDFLDARSDRATQRNWNRSWGLGDPSLPHELEQMKAAIAAHLRGERGGTDDPLLDPMRRRVAKELDRIIVESRVGRALDWRRVLREAFPRRRLVHPDYLKPNRRFPARIGEIPGRTRRPPRPALLVGVDTSGSMSVDTLSRVSREIALLALHARLTIVECDAAVHRIYPLAGSLGPFIGGGDTDFAPVFEEAKDARRFDGLVYFTDGKGEMPPTPPALPTLWVLTHEDPFDARFGVIVRLPLD